MLVLSRKCQERIMIGNDIVVTVVNFGGGKVSLGIDAPMSLKISRHEPVGELVGDPAGGRGSLRDNHTEG